MIPLKATILVPISLLDFRFLWISHPNQAQIPRSVRSHQWAGFSTSHLANFTATRCACIDRTGVLLQRASQPRMEAGNPFKGVRVKIEISHVLKKKKRSALWIIIFQRIIATFSNNQGCQPTRRGRNYPVSSIDTSRVSHGMAFSEGAFPREGRW